MTRASRTTWFLAATLLVAAVSIFATTTLSLPAEAFKERFEVAASDPLGLRVEVEGPVAVGFWGDLILRISDLRVRDATGAEVLRAERATVALAALPLLSGRSHVRRIGLERPTITIVRGRDGILN